MISCICARSCQIHEVRERESRWSPSRVVPVRSHQAKLITVLYPKPLGTFRERSASTVRLGGDSKTKSCQGTDRREKGGGETQKEKARNTATPGGKRVCTFDLAGHALPFFSRFASRFSLRPLLLTTRWEKKKGSQLENTSFSSSAPTRVCGCHHPPPSVQNVFGHFRSCVAKLHVLSRRKSFDWRSREQSRNSRYCRDSQCSPTMCVNHSCFLSIILQLERATRLILDDLPQSDDQRKVKQSLTWDMDSV